MTTETRITTSCTAVNASGFLKKVKLGDLLELIIGGRIDSFFLWLGQDYLYPFTSSFASTFNSIFKHLCEISAQSIAAVAPFLNRTILRIRVD